MRADPLSILEAIYADAPDDQAWLQSVVDIAEPILDQGFGVSAHTFAVRRDGVAFGSLCAGRAGRAAMSKVIQVMGPPTEAMASTPGMPTRFLSPYPYADGFLRIAGRGPESDRPVIDLWKRAYAQMNIQDMLGVIGGNPGNSGALLFAPSPSVIRATTPSLAMWSRIAAHVAAGYRLRAAGPVKPDAVLEPAGRLAHTEPSVSATDRQDLAWGARAMDRARGKLRRVDPARAVALWRGLVAGRWSLVDQFDHDGRRYVLAKRNPPRVQAWRKLTERETRVLEFAAHGQAHKVIGYELGISVSSVSETLSSAASKVGARSRLELVAAYRAARDGGSKTI